MHELSLAQNIVELVLESIGGEGGDALVVAVRLKVGELAGVVPESLLFCYDVVTRDTPLAGSRLLIERCPVVIRCDTCADRVSLPEVVPLCCPRCGTPAAAILDGKQLELASIELQEPAEDTPAR